MAAIIALGKTLAEPALSIISSFLEMSSAAATCGTVATDFSAVADAVIMAHCPSERQTLPDLLYLESLELESEWIGDVM